MGPYMFKTETGHSGERVRASMDLFVTELKDVKLNDLWFQQYGGTHHTANEIINLIKLKEENVW